MAQGLKFSTYEPGIQRVNGSKVKLFNVCVITYQIPVYKLDISLTDGCLQYVTKLVVRAEQIRQAEINQSNHLRREFSWEEDPATSLWHSFF